MASIAVTSKFVAVTCGNKTFAAELATDGKKLVLEPPNLQGQHAENVEESKETENNGTDAVDTDTIARGTPAHVVLASLSECSTRLVLCSNNKQLSLWDTSNLSLISNRVIVRTASAVKFTPSGRDILVADKSGDAYVYSAVKPNDEGVLILGHLSMLLDVLITPSEEFIITCDRDEKIRVSHFPNSYNIHTYCLGHSQFVSTISLLPHNPTSLLSSSGDGTMRLWDFMAGKSTLVLNCSDDLAASGCTPAVDASAEPNEATPVKCFTACRFQENCSTVVASLAGFSGCLVYMVRGCTESEISTQLIQTLVLDVEPLSIVLAESKLLWLLSPASTNVIDVLTFSESLSKFVLDPNLLDATTTQAVGFATERKDMFSCVNPPCCMKALYKRKFDNLQVYHERKKLRTLATAAN